LAIGRWVSRREAEGTVLADARERSIVRNVAVGAGAILLLAASALSYYSYSKALTDLASVAERSALSLNRLFANLLWPSYADFADSAKDMTPDAIIAHPRTRLMMSDVRELARGTHILKVKLFDRDGLTVFSTELAQIGTNSYTSPGLQAALAGRIDCKLERRDRFEGLDGPVVEPWLISCYLPIRDDAAGGGVTAIMEVYSDATEGYRDVIGHAGVHIAVIFAVLAAAFAVLMLVVRHAEREIGREQRRAMEMSTAKAEADAASQAKSTFLSNMSHKLRTPLNAIIGFSEMIGGEYFGKLGNDRYRNYAVHISEAGRHLLGIINDVLDFSKVEVGKMRVEFRPTEIAAVVRAALAMMEASARAGGVTMSADLAPDLPVATLDPDKLRQILLNLLSNAVKFTPPGGGVLVSARAVGTGRRRLLLAVDDTGIGMSEADIAVALRPFGQVENPLSRATGGTGLGLPLAKEFAAMMGGSLVVESAPRRGTSVRVELPFEPEASGAAETSSTVV